MLCLPCQPVIRPLSLTLPLCTALYTLRSLDFRSLSLSLAVKLYLKLHLQVVYVSLSELLLRLFDQLLSCLALRHMRVCASLLVCVCASRLVLTLSLSLSLSLSVPVGTLSLACCCAGVHQKLNDSRRYKTCVSHN